MRCYYNVGFRVPVYGQVSTLAALSATVAVVVDVVVVIVVKRSYKNILNEKDLCSLWAMVTTVKKYLASVVLI